MTKEFIDSIVKQLKEYVDAKLRGWGLSDEEKSLVAFEQKHMPYTQYSGNQSIDHVLFRKFLRLFDPEDIRNNLANHKQDKYDEGFKTADKTVVGAINEVKQKALDDYGPYENITLEAIATMLHDRLTLGKTIGVVEDGYVVEYWWQPNEEAGGKDVLVYYDDAAGVEFSYNYIGEREDIYDTPLYEWGNDSGANVYTMTKYSTSADNGVYRLFDGILYFIAPIDRIVHAYAFVKKAAGEGGGESLPPRPTPSIEVDTELDKDSTNPIANKAVAEKFEEIEGMIGTGGGGGADLSAYMKKDGSNYEGGIALVSPVISSKWTIKNPSTNTSTTDTNNTINLENGAKVDYEGSFRWASASGKKDPERCAGSFGTTLPANGQNSSKINKSDITTTTSYSVNLYANKGGLEVSGTKVIRATGEDTTSASAKVTFLHRRYWGTSASANVDIKTLSSELNNSKSKTIAFDCSGGKYFYYAYPKTLGNTSWNVGGLAFTGYTRTEEEITNEYGLKVTYYVYRSTNLLTGPNINAVIS